MQEEMVGGCAGKAGLVKQAHKPPSLFREGTIMDFDRDRAITRLMEFLAVEGTTGHERAIGDAVAASLRAAGVPGRWIKRDEAHASIPLPTETGNLIVTFPGTVSAPRRILSTHLDTVPLCAGAVPVRKGAKIVPQGKTALGGDDRAGVACLVTVATTLLERNIPHPPLTFLFTVREESGLWGVRFAKADDLGNPAWGFNADGGSPRQLTIGAVGADRWSVEIFGKASHAGVHPERGISSTMVAAVALAQVHKEGWFGKVVKKGHEGTSNVGPFGDEQGRCAGQATNVVTDYVKIQGESRSHETGFISAITRAYSQAFQAAAKSATNAGGQRARVKFTTRRDYFPFRLKESSPVVRIAKEAARQAGLDAETRISNGGLDANWLTRNGIPTVTFGIGQNEIHTVNEYVLIDDYLAGCRLALALATT
jgi:tripeptide aminopeptidase